MDVSKVLNAWENGKAGSTANGSLSTDGFNLFSYDLKIGKRQVLTIADNGIDYRVGGYVVGDFTARGIDFPRGFGYGHSSGFVSRTTSAHINRAVKETGAKLISISQFRSICYGDHSESYVGIKTHKTFSCSFRGKGRLI